MPPPLRFGSSTSLRVGNFKKEEFFCFDFCLQSRVKGGQISFLCHKPLYPLFHKVGDEIVAVKGFSLEGKENLGGGWIAFCGNWHFGLLHSFNALVGFLPDSYILLR